MDKKEIMFFLLERAKDGLISLCDIYDCMKETGLSFYDIEECAMESGLLPQRYERNRGILSISEQLKLLRSSVAIVGCGGLGGRVSELLARIGIGLLVCIDHDYFVEQNLNRQFFCNIHTLGRPKAIVLAEEIPKINPASRVIPKIEPFSIDSGTEIFSGVDVVIDALDSFKTRSELAASCYILRLPLVHGAIAGWFGQVGIQAENSIKFLKLFLSAQGKKEIQHDIGTPSFMPAVISAVQVAETVKILLKRNIGDFDKLFFVDLLSLSLESGNI